MAKKPETWAEKTHRMSEDIRKSLVENARHVIKTLGGEEPKTSTSLYDKQHKYTQDALDLEDKAMDLLEGHFKAYMKKGYSPREIGHVLKDAMTALEHKILLEEDYKREGVD